MVLARARLPTTRPPSLARQCRLLSSRAQRVLSALDFPADLATESVPGVFDGSWGGSGKEMISRCPATGEVLARVKSATVEETQRAIQKTAEAAKIVRRMPGPQRGEVIRQMREALASKVGELGDLVTLEMGKIKSEGKGEVQEFVDICDYATGLSRSMSGRVLPSERPEHVIYEVPNPLGVVGILSAFNFPVAVYGWNMAIAVATGNSTIWKPAPSTPLCAIAVTKLLQLVLERNGLPGAVASLVCGDVEVGKTVVDSPSVDLVSFTGSEKVGKEVGKMVQDRFGKPLLELGGNNAVIVDFDADVELALQAVLFAAIGTSSISSQFLARLLPTYDQAEGAPLLPVGDPLAPETLIGPLHNTSAVENYQRTLRGVTKRGGEIITRRSGRIEGGPEGFDAGKGEECFAPILFVGEFDTMEEAIALNNSVPQGLSSSLFTSNLQSMGKWLGPDGSDCGIVNINVGTSGAEIGAGFGGNKSTGWGRESGGDAWKQYVRWSAATVNYSNKMPLAQGVSFGASS